MRSYGSPLSGSKHLFPDQPLDLLLGVVAGDREVHHLGFHPPLGQELLEEGGEEGLVALDVILRTDGHVPPQHHAGGTCGNVLAILAYLGWSAYPVARLRPGAAADEIRADLAQWNVKSDFLARKRDGSTPIIVQRIEQGQKEEEEC